MPTAADSAQIKRSQRRKIRAEQARIGSTYLPLAMHGKQPPGVRCVQRQRNRCSSHRLHENARLFFAAQGITHIAQVITDYGSSYRSADFTFSLRESQHYRITSRTPRNTTGKTNATAVLSLKTCSTTARSNGISGYPDPARPSRYKGTVYYSAFRRYTLSACSVREVP